MYKSNQYASMQVFSMQLCKYTSLKVCKCTIGQGYKYSSMLVCKNQHMQVYKYASMQVYTCLYKKLNKKKEKSRNFREINSTALE